MPRTTERGRLLQHIIQMIELLTHVTKDEATSSDSMLSGIIYDRYLVVVI